MLNTGRRRRGRPQTRFMDEVKEGDAGKRVRWKQMIHYEKIKTSLYFFQPTNENGKSPSFITTVKFLLFTATMLLFGFALFTSHQ